MCPSYQCACAYFVIASCKSVVAAHHSRHVSLPVTLVLHHECHRCVLVPISLVTALPSFLQAARHEQQETMQEDELAYYEALEDLGNGYESYPESEEDAEDPEEVSVVGELLVVACLCPGQQPGGKRSMSELLGARSSFCYLSPLMLSLPVLGTFSLLLSLV